MRRRWTIGHVLGCSGKVHGRALTGVKRGRWPWETDAGGDAKILNH